jgi:AraC-like DNA-binding protein
MSFEFGFRQSDSPLVEYIWHTQTSTAGGAGFTSSAEYNWEIVVSKWAGRTHLTVRGPETIATPAPIPEGEAEYFGIVFKLGTFMPHLPVSVIRDRNDITLPEATNQSFWLLGSAWQFPTFDNADTFVNRMMRQDLLDRDYTVMAALQGRAPEMSLRTLQRRFVHATGLTQKTIQQIERAKRAVALLERGAPIADVTYATGYFDQAHLTNSLKRLMGRTPSEILRAPTNITGL